MLIKRTVQENGGIEPCGVRGHATGSTESWLDWRWWRRRELNPPDVLWFQ